MRIFDDKRCDDTIRLAIDRELGSIQLDASQRVLSWPSAGPA